MFHLYTHGIFTEIYESQGVGPAGSPYLQLSDDNNEARTRFYEDVNDSSFLYMTDKATTHALASRSARMAAHG